LCQCLRSWPRVLGAATTARASILLVRAMWFSASATPMAKPSSAWVSLSGLASLERRPGAPDRRSGISGVAIGLSWMSRLWPVLRNRLSFSPSATATRAPLGRFISDSTYERRKERALSVQRKRPLSRSIIRARLRRFVRQQPALALQPACVTGQGSLGADDAVAGHDDPDRIGSVGQPHGAHRRGLADGLRQLAVAPGPSRRNGAQRRPDRALEVGAAGLHGEAVQRRQVAVEIGGDGVPHPLRRAAGRQLNLAVMTGQQRHHPRLIVGEVESAHGPL